MQTDKHSGAPVSRRVFLRQTGLVIAGGGLLALSAGSGCGGNQGSLSSPEVPPVPVPPTRRVLVWSERTAPANPYPDDINVAIAAGIAPLLPPEWQVQTANIDEPDQGLAPDAIDAADVIVWWSHIRQQEVADAAADRIATRVREQGMGFIALHSGSWGAKPFNRITGSTGDWTGGAQILGEGNRILIAAPQHPIARGVSDFLLPEEERYLGSFNAPTPDTIVFDGIYEQDGTRAPQGMAWAMGNGRLFYFRPGHESFPVFFQPEVRQVLRNAVLWAAGDDAAI